MIIPIKRGLVLVFFVALLLWQFKYLNGFDSEAAVEGTHTVSFNWHALLMSASFLLFMGEGAFAFRQANGVKVDPSSVHRQARKKYHMVAMSLAIVWGAIGLALIIVNHNDHGFDNFYSAHSWFGIATLGLVVLQFAMGLYFFWFGNAAPQMKKRAMPIHRLGGVLILFCGLATMALGLLEKQTFITGKEGKWSTSAMWAGALTLMLMPIAMVFAYAFATPQEVEYVPVAVVADEAGDSS